MSRGPGRIQRAIHALIAGDEHGAWLVSDICKDVYSEFGDIEKKHQVAVNRALSSMELPEPWEAQYSGTQGNMRVLFNACDPESAAKAECLTKRDNDWDDFREQIASERHEPEIEESVPTGQKSIDSDELSELERRYEKANANIAFLESAGAHEAVRHWTDELRSLEKRRSKLVALTRRN